MEKHISIVGVLNIVYRAWTSLLGFLLLILGLSFDTILYHLREEGFIHRRDVPEFVLEFAPYLLIGISILVLSVSFFGILGGIGVLRRKEWGRILVLIVSFFNLIRVPLGTILGAYSIWALMSDDMIRLFRQPEAPPGASGGR